MPPPRREQHRVLLPQHRGVHHELSPPGRVRPELVRPAVVLRRPGQLRPHEPPHRRQDAAREQAPPALLLLRDVRVHGRLHVHGAAAVAAGPHDQDGFELQHGRVEGGVPPRRELRPRRQRRRHRREVAGTGREFHPKGGRRGQLHPRGDPPARVARGSIEEVLRPVLLRLLRLRRGPGLRRPVRGVLLRHGQESVRHTVLRDGRGRHLPRGPVRRVRRRPDARGLPRVLPHGLPALHLAVVAHDLRLRPSRSGPAHVLSRAGRSRQRLSAHSSRHGPAPEQVRRGAADDLRGSGHTHLEARRQLAVHGTGRLLSGVLRSECGDAGGEDQPAGHLGLRAAGAERVHGQPGGDPHR
mmetsp:Transcript_11335/g.21578  ORF Transcript_11335/g.21578 Transcript_11335/m.21578 type:complete len:355 (+) Transcript_11335:82-1146(+)